MLFSVKLLDPNSGIAAGTIDITSTTNSDIIRECKDKKLILEVRT